ncbi:hypothetical protein G7Y89_g9150 [Cudoniella acicularis]|uniref:Cytochrome P450 n=1 Tax=Cudoniella acicularis TaxID=354080 RepID=A0A8H4RHI5_9HELO|nr:hypothetical protein G7Y89_g9150 [Cudoniella acicularis]
MFTSASTLLLSAVVLSSGYILWTKIRIWSAASKADCSSPVKYRHLDPFYGLDLFIRKIKHTQAGNLLALDEEIFAKYGKTFGNEPTNRKPCGPLLGDGAFTVDGALWKRSRDIINPIFSRSQVSQLSSLKTHFQRFIEHIPTNGSTIDIQPLTKMLFLDSSTEFIFGKSAGSLSPSELTIGARQFSEAFDDGLRGMRKNYMTGQFSWLIGTDKKWLEKCAEIHTIVDGYIEEEIEHQKHIKELGLSSSDTSEPSAYKYVLLRELVKKHSDDKLYIRNELMNVFFAARDSVGTVTASMLFLLARYPKVWQKLRKEVAGIVPLQELTFEFLKSLKYVQAVIEETLRLVHPVDRSWKTCLSSCVLPRGGGKSGRDPILLQPGDQIELIYGCMHKDKDIWGEDASEFVPERMLGLKHSWQYIPFMGGRRTCPGQQNAYTDMAFFLVKLAQEFKTIENRDDCLEYVEEYVMTKQSANGVKIAFTRN